MPSEAHFAGVQPNTLEFILANFSRRRAISRRTAQENTGRQCHERAGYQRIG